MKMPEVKIYELEMEYLPYKALWNMVLEHIVEYAPQNGTLIDLMCGTGFLLRQISAGRPDLWLKGVDKDRRYITHAQQECFDIHFELADVLALEDEEKYDVVICTGALHHIVYERQREVIQKMASLVKKGGVVLISDCYIDDYADETERMLAAAKLGYEYLAETIKNQPPRQVIKPCLEILANDVLKKEFKTSLAKRRLILGEIFEVVITTQAWPDCDSDYGDYMSICMK